MLRHYLTIKICLCNILIYKCERDKGIKSMPQNGVYDLLKMLEITLDGGYSVLKYTVVNKKEMETLIDRIYAALPLEVQEARVFLKKKEELQNEAQQKS